MPSPLLSITDLAARFEEKDILKGLSLTVKAGEVHALMGPNGAGKSTLGAVLAGRDGFTVTSGSAIFCGQDLLALKTEERVAAGLFLALQYPVEIPGVSTLLFLRTALNALRTARGEAELDAPAALRLIREKARVLDVTDEMLKRPVNVGFSGGEKKRMEALQLLLLEPRLAILDETDSGLDIDALKRVATTINAFRSAARALVVITHYRRLLDYIRPDVVHILSDGRITRSGGFELVEALEAEGYAGLSPEAA